MATISKKFGFIRTTLANWSASLFAGRAGIVTDSTPGPVERWGWYDGSSWRFAATSGASEVFGTLTLNGATRQAWGAAYTNMLHLGGTAVVGEKNLGTGSTVRMAVNWYHDGTSNRAIESGTGAKYPAFLDVGANGDLNLVTSLTNPTAGGVISDFAARWRVSKEGGCGFFGVAAPTTRPTVNAACTDLATCIALTNQLRTHLIACGLVQ